MIRFTADDKFNARLEEMSNDLYNAVKVLREDDWLYHLTEWRVRSRILEILDYIENGFPEDEAADISTEIHRLGC